MKRYIHEFQKHLNRQLELLKESSILPENQELIRDFYHHNLAKDISVPQMVRQVQTLRMAAKQFAYRALFFI